MIKLWRLLNIKRIKVYVHIMDEARWRIIACNFNSLMERATGWQLRYLNVIFWPAQG
jgi:hypothetical protein